MSIGADVFLPTLDDHALTAEDHAIRTAVRLVEIRDEALDRTKIFKITIKKDTRGILLSLAIILVI